MERLRGVNGWVLISLPFIQLTHTGVNMNSYRSKCELIQEIILFQLQMKQFTWIVHSLFYETGSLTFLSVGTTNTILNGFRLLQQCV